MEKLHGVNSVHYTELTPRSFSNISRLFTNIQFLSLHKSKLWWKSHLFCERHFLIRSIVWPLFWYELSPENYIFLILVITIKLSTWSKNILHKKDVSFFVVSIQVKKLQVCEQLRYVHLPNFTEFTPQIFFRIFLWCLQTYSCFFI